MNTQIKQIAQRLHGLRDALNLTTEVVASKCGITQEQYEKYETGNFDIPLSFICDLAQTFGVETTALFSGNDPHALAFSVTRKGTGSVVERNKVYKYQSLAHGFRFAKAEPFEVTVEPSDNPIHLNSHTGQEFNLILKGTMQLQIASNDITLYEGDSIYFDSIKPHGMKALNGEKVTFLAVII